MSRRFTATTNDIERRLSQHELVHSKNVRMIVAFLKPRADECLLIAAAGHDIGDSIFNEPRATTRQDRERRAHRDAQIIADIMKAHGYAEHSIQRTQWLIERHESTTTPTDEDLYILQTADVYDNAVRKVYEILPPAAAEALSKRLLRKIAPAMLKKLEPLRHRLAKTSTKKS